jgi:outer membrane lipoprotein-sorting protein
MSDDRLTHYRDDELGAALRELDVPEHRPGFEAELHRLLAEERPATGRLGLRWGLRLALVAGVAAIVLLVVGIPRTDRTPRIAGPEVATAAQIKAQVQTALATLENLSGTVVSDGPRKGDRQRWRFTLTAAGDFLLVGPGEGERLAYDASEGVVRGAQTSASIGGDTLFYSERRGVAPGPPDPGPPTGPLPDQYGAFVRALLAAEDPRVREVTYDGRPAWRLEIDVEPNAIVPEFSGDRLEIAVDRETGLPVRLLVTKDGAFLEELRIEGLAVNRDLAPDTFELKFPAGADVARMDDGYRRTALDEVAGAVGYAPLVPAWVPTGYGLAEVAVAKHGAPTGTEGGNPPARKVVSLSYRRGLDQFLVTTRLARVPSEIDPDLPPQEAWSDPLASGEGFVDKPERLTIEQGALAGERAELVVVPRGIPHLWALTDELVVTVSGDLTRAELVRITESLERRS